MDVKKGREVVSQYRDMLRYTPLSEAPSNDQPRPHEAVGHIKGMLDKMDKFLDEVEDPMRDSYEDPRESWDKFNRWLGFIQGCFWTHGLFTLNQMREHNRT